MTPLTPVEPRSIEEFWARAVAAGAVADDAPVRSAAEVFGDSQELADELIALVTVGPKRATVGALVDYEHEGAPLPFVGECWIAADGHGRPRALLRTTDVRIGPLASVDDQFAWDEGEGDRTRATWLADHEAYFRRYLPTIGVEFHDDLEFAFERFELLYTE